MRHATRDALAPLLVAADGVVTRAALHRAGLDPHLPAQEGWLRLAPRTWWTGGGAPPDAVLARAALLHAGPDAVVTGPVACRLHLLEDVPADPGVDVLVRHGRRLRSTAFVRVHQTTRLPPQVRRRGAVVAPVHRALADTARWCDDLRDVRALLLTALDSGRVDAEELRAEVEEGERRGRAALVRVLADHARGACSAPEAEAADAVAALPRRVRPRFVLNPHLVLHGRYLGRPDGYLPGAGLGWEVDSVRHHGSSRALAATLQRHQDFADAGVELVHVVPAVLRRDPQR